MSLKQAYLPEEEKRETSTARVRVVVKFYDRFSAEFLSFVLFTLVLPTLTVILNYIVEATSKPFRGYPQPPHHPLTYVADRNWGRQAVEDFQLKVHSSPPGGWT